MLSVDAYFSLYSHKVNFYEKFSMAVNCNVKNASVRM